jgi:hypothetical protein
MNAVRFYCEQCGAQAKPHDRICRKCGSFFNLVRCPKCRRQGEVEEFMNGCLNCGYEGDLGAKTAASDSLVEVDYPFDPPESPKKPARLPWLIGVGLFTITFVVLAMLFVANKR